MRLFIGVELDDAARAAVHRVAGQLRGQLDGRLRANWVAPANYHLTVRFIGQVPDDRAPALLDALAPSARISPFEITLAQCGSFPPRGPARVIWVGVTRGMSSLRALHEEFNERLVPFGYEPEKRAFSAHLTLARVKDAGPGVTRQISETLRSVADDAIAFTAARATVFESRLSARGPAYHPRQYCELGGTNH